MSTNKSSNSEHISPEETKASLLRSGYLLESRVEQFLEERGYYVEANSVYPDPNTNKTREFDIYALTNHSINDRFHWVWSVMLVECVNNPQPIAFITKEPRIPEEYRYEIKLAGLPTKIIQDKNTWVSVVDVLEMVKYHHYCSGRIATQFCSFTKKKNSDEWMAFHDDSHFESIQKLCDITNFHVNSLLENWQGNNVETVNIEFYYPLIVVQGELLDVRPHKTSGVEIQPTNHIHFVKTTMQNNKPETYHIDIITEDYLPKYFGIINSEMTETIKSIKNNIQIMNKSIDTIIKEFKKANSPEAKRAVLSF